MSPPSPRRLFVAGATGAVGRNVVRLGREGGIDLVPHARPKAGPRTDLPEGAAVFDLADAAALRDALDGSTTILQLIGTIRKRFAQGDTYETSDIATTRYLVNAAREAKIDHLVLLSSVGAGRPLGPYFRAKAKAEALVRDSGIAWTVLRPSAFRGERHQAPAWMDSATRALGLHRYRPIAIEDLSRALLSVARQRAPLDVALEGKSLWQVVELA